MSAPRRCSNSVSRKAHKAPVIASVKVESGRGTCAREKSPTVVAATTPAVTPTAGTNNLAPSHAVASTMPSPPTTDGSAAVRGVTAPPGRETRAISQAWSGGLLSIGVPAIAGASQCPWATMSRAMAGNRASSLVRKTHPPRSSA